MRQDGDEPGCVAVTYSLDRVLRMIGDRYAAPAFKSSMLSVMIEHSWPLIYKGTRLMRHDHDSEALLVRYLLGDLSERENVEIEERAFSDQEFMQTIQSAESDLIDAYARGELSERECQQFESRFVSPKQVKTVEFAKTLIRVLPVPERDRKKA